MATDSIATKHLIRTPANNACVSAHLNERIGTRVY